MSIDNQFLIKKVMQKEQLIACICPKTRMPFVYCDPVSYADQVWIFADEEGLKEFVERFAAKKLPLQGVAIKKTQFNGFLGSLLHIGITEVVYTENHASVAIPIEQFVRHKDMSDIPEALRPLENPQLQLTGLYLMQEVHRSVPAEEKEDLADLNEEFMVNLARSRYMMPVQLQNGPGSAVEKLQKRQFAFMNLTLKNGDMFRPIFSDSMEFQRFRQNKKEIQALTLPFASLKSSFQDNMKGYLLNPNGCQIVLNRQLIDQVLKNFPDAVKQGNDEAMRLSQSLAGPQMRGKAAENNPASPSGSKEGNPSVNLSKGKITKMPEKKD